ncbi:MAG: FAD-dependent oxidoreductase [Candidatus Latescibacterota bacterium]
MVNLTIDDRPIQVEDGKTILEAAETAGIHIPTLCYHKALSPYGACRICLVEIVEGARPAIQASCIYVAREGLVVRTDTERVLRTRRMMVELLLARSPESEKIKELARQMGVKETRLKKRNQDCILCGLCVRMCQERMGKSVIGFAKRGIEREVSPPFDRRSALCMGCGACEFVCPTGAIKASDNSEREIVPMASEFDMGLVSRPAVSLMYPQAVPNTPSIDKERCVHFLTGKCAVCQDTCVAKAIDFEQEEEHLDLQVGAIVLGAGYERFDARLKLEYGYGIFPNVVTSPEFERILSASGPFAGHLVRPSDKTIPLKIAFLQCVGSRDLDCGNRYCSSVCCMFATKEAVVAREHEPDVDCHIYYMDIRAFGKGFDGYYERAKNEYKVDYRRCRVGSVAEIRGGNDLLVRYETESGDLKEETYNLVVLATGFVPPPGLRKIGKTLGLEVNEHGFLKTDHFFREMTGREGIYACGALSEPKDIPTTVTESSAAAAFASGILAEARGTLIEESVYPEERDVSGEEPRIGVFVCHCGINIASVIRVEEVVDRLKELPNVVYAERNLYTCSQDTQNKIKDIIAQHNLNRIVISSCTPRTHEPLFQDTIREAGLNPFLLEFVNIREHCSWVHQTQKEAATEKAVDLVKMAIAKARLLRPLHRSSSPVIKKGLVVGGGISGITAARSLAKQGFEVYLVEREGELGGNVKDLHYTLEGDDPQKLLRESIEALKENPRIHLYTHSQITQSGGYLGNYTTTLETNPSESQGPDPSGSVTQVEHGVLIIATGAKELETVEYLYGQDARVITQRELEGRIAKDDLLAAGAEEKDSAAAGKKRSKKKKNPKSVVMIQCVGSRNEERPYCSRVCCSEAIKNAIRIKEIDPKIDVFVIYRDIRTYGFKEVYYEKARALGVIFIRYDLDEKPDVSTGEDGLTVLVTDPVLGARIALNPDLLVLSVGIVPNENEELAKLLKVPLTQDGFFLEAHAKLRPLDFSTDGVYLCGLAHSPKFASECISQANGAAGRAATILAKDSIQGKGRTVEVRERICAGCGLCVTICPYGAREIDEEKGIARTTEVLCQGCGTCVMYCPNKATIQSGFGTEELLSAVDALL